MPVLSRLEKISGAINHWIEHLLFGMGLTMALLVAVQVFFRYILNQSLFWSEELARYLLVWLTFLGVSAAYYRKANPGVDFLYARVSPRLRKTADVMIHCVSMGLFVVMIVFGTQFAYFVRMQISPAMNLPKWLIVGIIPVSGMLLMFHALTFLVAVLQRGDRDH